MSSAYTKQINALRPCPPRAHALPSNPEMNPLLRPVHPQFPQETHAYADPKHTSKRLNPLANSNDLDATAVSDSQKRCKEFEMQSAVNVVPRPRSKPEHSRKRTRRPKSKRPKTGPRKKRRDSSLKQICTAILTHFLTQKKDVIRLNDFAQDLGVERRRIYDIINVLEGFDVIWKRGKNLYQWRGLLGFEENLCRLEAAGEGIHDAKVFSFEHKDPRLKKKSLTFLSIKLLKLFIVYKENINFKELIKLFGQKYLKLNLNADDKDLKRAENKNKIRRLYDIVNVFKSLGLICKTTSPSGRSVFQFKGLPGLRSNVTDLVSDARKSSERLNASKSGILSKSDALETSETNMGKENYQTNGYLAKDMKGRQISLNEDGIGLGNSFGHDSVKSKAKAFPLDDYFHNTLPSDYMMRFSQASMPQQRTKTSAVLSRPNVDPKVTKIFEERPTEDRSKASRTSLPSHEIRNFEGILDESEPRFEQNEACQILNQTVQSIEISPTQERVNLLDSKQGKFDFGSKITLRKSKMSFESCNVSNLLTESSQTGSNSQKSTARSFCLNESPDLSYDRVFAPLGQNFSRKFSSRETLAMNHSLLSPIELSKKEISLTQKMPLFFDINTCKNDTQLLKKRSSLFGTGPLLSNSGLTVFNDFVKFPGFLGSLKSLNNENSHPFGSNTTPHFKRIKSSQDQARAELFSRDFTQNEPIETTPVSLNRRGSLFENLTRIKSENSNLSHQNNQNPMSNSGILRPTPIRKRVSPGRFGLADLDCSTRSKLIPLLKNAMPEALLPAEFRPSEAQKRFSELRKKELKRRARQAEEALKRVEREGVAPAVGLLLRAVRALAMRLPQMG